MNEKRVKTIKSIGTSAGCGGTPDRWLRRAIACGANFRFPKEEMVRLTSQIRRSAASSPRIIGRGHGEKARGTFIQYLRSLKGH